MVPRQNVTSSNNIFLASSRVVRSSWSFLICSLSLSSLHPLRSSPTKSFANMSQWSVNLSQCHVFEVHFHDFHAPLMASQLRRRYLPHHGLHPCHRRLHPLQLWWHLFSRWLRPSLLQHFHSFLQLHCSFLRVLKPNNAPLKAWQFNLLLEKKIVITLCNFGFSSFNLLFSMIVVLPFLIIVKKSVEVL